MLLFLPSWPPSSSPHAPLPLSSLLPHSPSSLPKVLKKCFPGGFFGEDREGNPVWYDAMGNIDFKGQTSREFDHMIITWSSHDHHMTVTWSSDDTWSSHDSHDHHIITWLSHDHHMTHDHHMAVTWAIECVQVCTALQRRRTSLNWRCLIWRPPSSTSRSIQRG